MNILPIVWVLLYWVSAFGLYAQTPTVSSRALEQPVFQTTDAMRTEVRFVVDALESLHYMRQPIQNIPPSDILRSYIEQFDPFHLLLTEPEIQAIESRFGPSLSFYLKQGNLFPAFEIFHDIRQRSAQRAEWIHQHLQQPFDFETGQTFTPDRRFLPWPKDKQQADILWHERLQYDLINEIIYQQPLDHRLDQPSLLWSDWSSQVWIPTWVISARPNWVYIVQSYRHVKPLAWLSVWKDQSQRSLEEEAAYQKGINYRLFQQDLASAIEVLQERYERLNESIQELEPTDVQEAFLSSLARQYDPHSLFFSADSMEDFAIAIRNSLVGIGAVLTDEDGYCTIREIIPGSPAANSNILKPGDVIMGIAQGNGLMVDVVGMKLKKVVKMIRGPKGTSVRLSIKPIGGDPSERIIVTLIRDEIEITNSLSQAQWVEFPTTAGPKKIGIIDVPAFYGSDEEGVVKTSTTQDVKELIAKLKALGIEGLILDIRRNGGGLLSEAISLTGAFLTTGPVLQVKDTLGRLNEFSDDDIGIDWDGPLIVLVSRYSASASEIVAGALKDQNRALIVGDPSTHGKGTVQVILDIDRSSSQRSQKSRLGSAKITVQKWYRPNGNSTQLKGVESDIILPSIHPFLPIGESDLPHAMPWDVIRPLPWAYDTTFAIPASLKEILIQNSTQRQNNLLEFTYLQSDVEHFKTKQNQKQFSLNLHHRQNQRLAEERFYQDLESKFQSIPKSDFVFQKIQLDAVERTQQNHPSPLYPDSPYQNHDLDVGIRESIRIMADWLGQKHAFEFL